MNTTMKVLESEENEVYNIISKALFSLCEVKPSNPIDFLSRKLLTLIGDNPDLILRGPNRKTLSNINIKKEEDNTFITSEKYVKTFENTYTIERKLGIGSYGTTALCFENNNPDTKYVVKIIKKEQFNSDLSDSLKEKYIKLVNPFICDVSEILDDEKHIYMLEEYCDDGNLMDFILNGKLKDENKVKQIARSLILAIEYLNENGFVHKNIKPENILVQKADGGDITFKLSDYGLNSLLILKETRSEIVVNPSYLAPEFFFDIKDQSKFDYWQVGIICYLLLVGQLPFEGTDLEVALQMKYKEIVIPDFVKGDGRDFVQKLLQKDTSLRMGKEAVDHPWIKKENIKVDKEVIVTEEIQEEALKNIFKFASGNALRKTIFNYLMSRTTYNDQQAEFVKLFKDLDSNGDGNIDANELYKGYNKFFPTTEKNVKARIREMVKNADIDGNGTINFNEFMFITNQMEKEMNESKLKDLFNMFDVTGSGYIDKMDLKIVLKDPKLSNSQLDKMIEEFDQDGDNKLSISEFYDLITK